MATCREVIDRAYLKAKVRARGDTASAEETADAMISLQAIYDEMIGLSVFGRLTEVIIEAAYEAGENERIYNTTGGALTVTLPQTVVDSFTGETRPPKDRAIVVVVEDPAEAYLYEAPLGSWVALTALVEATYAPLSVRSLDGLASVLAVRLMEENGVEPGPVLANSSNVFRSMIARRADSPRETTLAEFF